MAPRVALRRPLWWEGVRDGCGSGGYWPRRQPDWCSSGTQHAGCWRRFSANGGRRDGRRGAGACFGDWNAERWSGTASEYRCRVSEVLARLRQWTVDRDQLLLIHASFTSFPPR